MLKIADEQATYSHGWLTRWPDWIAYATMVWSLLYALLGLFWTLGSKGFPFGAGDPNPEYSIFRGLPVEVGAPLIAALGCLCTVVALCLASGWGRGIVRGAGRAFAWVCALLLLLVIPDDRLLACVAHSFLLHFEMFNWTVINEFYCILGGILWIGTAVVAGREAHQACLYCGRRSDIAIGWTRPEQALKWGRWAVAVAVFVPLIYCTTRWAFALGIPLGVSAEFLSSMERENPGIWLGGASIATLGLGGALLTLGLIQRWGEVFPRWMIGLAGKRVPPLLAIIPATVVSIIVIEAGIGLIRHTINGTGVFSAQALAQDPSTVVPGLFWPLWGIALGLATLAYYYRRRGRCTHCGQE
ncbi:hypothetical protein EPA93_05475 [Ktedonosporobacter rubrisoli]|uniref:DUF3995 domain-containing protein n=1 Tax=Ktedonosporobacter rubrisoli TaxID=2509675 RepID=A0A4V0YY99_KTERU|nr:hypothetical protein [Ktedonosporobacter rubrisoli]QBD75481.1 hypothetical protein EPA93_05475 [Ktedonosporobacter rubrisoli]